MRDVVEQDTLDRKARLEIEYCGEWFHPTPGRPFTIGREADLAIDENPYLHRKFLRLVFADGLWWLANIGDRLSATVCDVDAAVQSWLPPAARIPIVFRVTTVVFTAGSTTYELALHVDSPVYSEVRTATEDVGLASVGDVAFTLSQRQLVVALAETMLRREGAGVSQIPASAQAAARLGWSLTKFNRKLDNVCDKLDRMGVSGMRGGRGAIATNRRARLVEYAVSSRLVTAADLPLLDLPPESEPEA